MLVRSKRFNRSSSLRTSSCLGVYMYIYVLPYIYVYMLPYIYIYITMLSMYIYATIYIYIERERERYAYMYAHRCAMSMYIYIYMYSQCACDCVSCTGKSPCNNKDRKTVPRFPLKSPQHDKELVPRVYGFVSKSFCQPKMRTIRKGYTHTSFMVSIAVHPNVL